MNKWVIFNGMKHVYLDYASITPIDPLVRKEMDKWNREPLNPSSIHSLGVKAKKILDRSRKSTAEFLNAHADEIVFTSGGTEANSLTLEGACRAAYRSFKNIGKARSKPHLIISSIEHSSILETADMLERQGVEVTRLAVDKNGLVSLEQLKKAIKPETFLVSIMTVNNEIGTIEPIREIAKIVRDARKNMSGGKALYPLFHTDACQAILYEELNVEKLGVDLLTMDASKAFGPRGIGALYVKRRTPIEPLIYGGGQENELRSGTENIPGAAGFARALQIAGEKMEKESRRIGELRDLFEGEAKKIRPDSMVNAAGVPRAPHISNIAFPSIDAEMIVLRLDAKGIAVSTKSACLRDEDESYVLRAIGADSRSSIRFSFGRWTKRGDLKKVLNLLSKFVQGNPLNKN